MGSSRSGPASLAAMPGRALLSPTVPDSSSRLATAKGFKVRPSPRKNYGDAPSNTEFATSASGMERPKKVNSGVSP
jgi:hypothetical protein